MGLYVSFEYWALQNMFLNKSRLIMTWPNMHVVKDSCDSVSDQEKHFMSSSVFFLLLPIIPYG